MVEKKSQAKKKKRTLKKTAPLENKAKPKLTWLPKKTFELEFSIPWKDVQTAYQVVLKSTALKLKIKGFRPGKAPLEMAEKQLDKQKLYQQTLEKILSPAYAEAVKTHQLRPIISPKITPVIMDENKDWQFKAAACEAPSINLGDYQKQIKAELAKGSLWVPGKSGDDKKQKQPSDDEKMKIATQALLKNISVEISDILIEDEVNRMLTRLLDQVNGLGMTIDQYLSSKNTNQEQLRMEFKIQAEKTLKLEFILQQIVNDRKITADEQEIQTMIKNVPDEKTREKLNNPLQKAYLGLILAKRKALDYLISL